MKIAILGGRGQLGSEFDDCNDNPSITENHDFDVLTCMFGLNDEDECIYLSRYDVIINCIAYNDVDGAEREENRSDCIRANVEIPRKLAEICKENNQTLIHFSTNYVFDGSYDKPYAEDRFTIPLNEYGKSKLAGENAIKDSGCSYLIFRLSALYSNKENNFPHKIKQKAKERDIIHVVDDQFVQPTWTKDVVKAVFEVIDQLDLSKEYYGVYHLASSGSCSWAEFAKVILGDRIEPIPSTFFTHTAERPRNGVLDCRKILNNFGVKLPHWRESYEKFLWENQEANPNVVRYVHGREGI